MNLVAKLPVKSVRSGSVKWFVRIFEDALPVAAGDHFEILPRGQRALVVTRTYLASLRSYELELSEVTAGPEGVGALRENGWEDAR